MNSDIVLQFNILGTLLKALSRVFFIAMCGEISFELKKIGNRYSNLIEESWNSVMM